MLENDLTVKQMVELRIKCLELSKELYKNDNLFAILMVAQEMYKFIVRENDAEIDAVIADFDKRKERFNRLL